MYGTDFYQSKSFCKYFLKYIFCFLYLPVNVEFAAGGRGQGAGGREQGAGSRATCNCNGLRAQGAERRAQGAGHRA